jgi:flagellar protein FlaF
MGFSSTAGFVIILSTLLVCSIYLYSAVDLSTEKISIAYSDYMERTQDKLNENLEITSAVNISNEIYITLLNNGSQTLEPSKWTVLYDGVPMNFSIVSNTTYLTPLNYVTLRINATAPARICIVSEYGNKHYCSVG